MATPSHYSGTTYPCPKCGAAVARDQKFCMNCGTPVTPPEICQACGAPAEEDAKFCQFCGTPMAQEPAAPVRQAPPAQPVSPPPPEDTPPSPPAPEKRRPPAQAPAPERAPEIPKPPAPPEPVAEQPVPVKPRTQPPPEPVPGPEIHAEEPEAPPLPKKPRPKRKGALLKAGVLLIVVAALVLAGYFAMPMISSGSIPGAAAPIPTTEPTPAETPTVVETPVPVTETTPVPTATAGGLVPGPVDTLPPGTEVHVSVMPKDPGDQTVTVLFEGGPGMNIIRTCVVRLTRSDGEVVNGMLDTSRRGSEVTLPGTRGTDRVEVLVRQFTGNTYTIIDQLVPYR